MKSINEYKEVKNLSRYRKKAAGRLTNAIAKYDLEYDWLWCFLRGFWRGVRHFTDTKGVTSRLDFWSFIVHVFIINVVLILLLIDLIYYLRIGGFTSENILALPLLLLLLLFFFVATVNVARRRCNDAGVKQSWVLRPFARMRIFMKPSIYDKEEEEEIGNDGPHILLDNDKWVIGDLDDEFVQHGYTCVIKAQQIVLCKYGVRVSEEECLATARENRWCEWRGGTYHENYGKVLQYYGVPYHTVEHSSMEILVDEVSKGHLIIASVDYEELYSPEIHRRVVDSVDGKRCDHGVVVTGVDFRNRDKRYVYVTDSAIGVNNYPCPLDAFVDAWDDSGSFMIATDVPLPK